MLGRQMRLQCLAHGPAASPWPTTEKGQASINPGLGLDILDVVRQGVGADGPIADINLMRGYVHPRQRMFHPILVVAIWKILTRVRTAALFPVQGRDDRG